MKIKTIVLTTFYFVVAIPTFFLISLGFLDILNPPYEILENGEKGMLMDTSNVIFSSLIAVVLSILLFVVFIKWMKK